MPVVIECGVCGKTFNESPSRAHKRKYCSFECKGVARTTQVAVECEECGVNFDVINVRKDAARFCSKECWLSNNRKTEAERNFWPKVKKSDGCWDWEATPKPNGYGRCRYLGKDQLAHRVSYMIHFGEIPDGLLVCHTCDNRNCVNPEHLFLGTHKDNLDDMRAKGRGRGYFRYPKEIADGIREMRGAGLSCRDVGEHFGVSESYVSDVYRGAIRRDVY